MDDLVDSHSVERLRVSEILETVWNKTFALCQVYKTNWY